MAVAFTVTAPVVSSETKGWGTGADRSWRRKESVGATLNSERHSSRSRLDARYARRRDLGRVLLIVARPLEWRSLRLTGRESRASRTIMEGVPDPWRFRVRARWRRGTMGDGPASRGSRGRARVRLSI